MDAAKKVVFIFGPTGVGKTELAVKVAEGFGEIISVDSMQVYRGLDLGTAKPTYDQLNRVRHHLVSIVPPDFRFSAGDFRRRALRVIDEIYLRKKVPVLVGGTGLYFRVLEYNLSGAPNASGKREYSMQNCRTWIRILLPGFTPMTPYGLYVHSRCACYRAESFLLFCERVVLLM